MALLASRGLRPAMTLALRGLGRGRLPHRVGACFRAIACPEATGSRPLKHGTPTRAVPVSTLDVTSRTQKRRQSAPWFAVRSLEAFYSGISDFAAGPHFHSAAGTSIRLLVGVPLSTTLARLLLTKYAGVGLAFLRFQQVKSGIVLLDALWDGSRCFPRISARPYFFAALVEVGPTSVPWRRAVAGAGRQPDAAEQHLRPRRRRRQREQLLGAHEPRPTV